MDSSDIHRPVLRRSLATRLAVVWAIMLGSAVGFSSWTLHREAHQNLKNNLRRGIEGDAEEIQLRIDTWMRGLKEDARSVSRSPLVLEFLKHLHTPEEGRWRQLLEDEFRAVFAGKPTYFQMRLLSAENMEDGQEILRLDRKEGKLEVTPKKSLQKKAHRPYYREALGTPRGSVYLSEINLNRDFGGITVPHIPTIRAAVRVGDEASHPAMLIINADLRPLFDEIHDLASDHAEVRLLDYDRHYLIHPNPKVPFASDTGYQIQASDEFPGWKAGMVLPGDGCSLDFGELDHQIAFGKSISSEGWPNRELNLIVSLPEKAWQPEFFLFRRRAIWATVLAVLAGAGVAILVLIPFTRGLRRLTTALRRFDAGEEPEIPNSTVLGNDEVSIAIQRFQEMAAKVRKQVGWLRTVRDEAQEANAVKESFLATMSHEIRTPLNAIVGLIRALEENNPSPHQKPILNSLTASASNLVTLLNTALDYSRLREGTIEYLRENFDSADLVREVGRSLSPIAQSKHLKLEMETPETLWVQGDPVRLRQVTNNLVNNAIKFTEEGFVKISLTYGNECLTLAVSDSGPGIDPEKQEQIFTPYVSLKHGNSREDSGAGLGLSVSKEIVEQQGGKLTLMSRSGNGCEFTVKLPYPEAAVPTGPNSSDSGFQAGSTIIGRPRILYVEDVVSNQEVMAMTLEGSRVDLTCVSHGVEALEILSQEDFDLVLVDLQLPDMDGDELARRILTKNPSLKMGAVTAQSSARTDQKLKEAGIHDVVIKPYTRKDIENLIARHLNPSFTKILNDIHPGNPGRAEKLAADMATELQQAAASLRKLGNRADWQDGSGEIERMGHKLKTATARFQLDQFELLLGEFLASKTVDRELLEKAVDQLGQTADDLRNWHQPSFSDLAGNPSNESSNTTESGKGL